MILFLFFPPVFSIFYGEGITIKYDRHDLSLLHCQSIMVNECSVYWYSSWFSFLSFPFSPLIFSTYSSGFGYTAATCIGL